MHLYMLEIFTDHDTDKDVIIKLVEFMRNDVSPPAAPDSWNLSPCQRRLGQRPPRLSWSLGTIRKD